MIWTEREDRILRELHDTVSFTVIGARIGVSRNAAIGRARRLGLSCKNFFDGRYKEPPPRPKAKPFRRPKRMANHIARVRALKHPPAIMTPEPVPVGPVLAPTCPPVTLLARTDDQCPFPVSDTQGPQTLFCGAPNEPGRHWCGYHQWIVYQKGTAMRGHMSARHSQLAEAAE